MRAPRLLHWPALAVAAIVLALAACARPAADPGNPSQRGSTAAPATPTATGSAAPTATDPAPHPTPQRPREALRPRRGVYVADTPALLDDPTRRAALIRFVQTHRIDTLVFYGLGDVFDHPRRQPLFATFSEELRRAGVVSLGAPIAGHDRIPRVLDHNRRYPHAAIDALVTELEYWTRCADGARPEDPDQLRPDCFPPMEALLAAMRAAAAEEAAAGRPVRVGAYLGYPTATEARRIAALSDYVLLNYHLRHPSSAGSHVHRRGGPLSVRLQHLRATGAELWPILYAQGEVDLAPSAWHAGLTALESTFLAALDPAAHPSIAGLHYFPYEALEHLLEQP